jgi:hypothetical protein
MLYGNVARTTFRLPPPTVAPMSPARPGLSYGIFGRNQLSGAGCDLSAAPLCLLEPQLLDFGFCQRLEAAEEFVGNRSAGSGFEPERFTHDLVDGHGFITSPRGV